MQRRKIIGIRLTESERNDLNEYCKNKRIKLSAVVRAALNKYLAEIERSQSGIACAEKMA